MSADAKTQGDRGPNRFATTRWSLILACAKSDAEQQQTARRALAELCQIYWQPIFAFLCHRGYSVSDAQDLTQDFFIVIIEGNLLSVADPRRGRFRSLLLKALQNFLNDNHDRKSAQKRGGDKYFVPWQDWMAESPSTTRSSSFKRLENCSSELVFDLRWAVTVTEQALRRLAQDCENRGRARMFSILSEYLLMDREKVSYANLAASLEIPERSVKKLLHHFRARYRSILRDEVLQTVEGPEDVDGEIRYLCDVLGSNGM